MTDNRQKIAKVNNESSLFLEYYLFIEKKKFFLSFAEKVKTLQLLDQEKHKLRQIYIWNPVTTRYNIILLCFVIQFCTCIKH